MIEVRTLDTDELHALHDASLTVLSEVGVRVGLPEAVDRLSAAGARVDVEGADARVRLPAELVERCLAAAPRTIVCAGRDPAADFVAEQGRLTFTSFGECLNVVDAETGQRRAATKTDCADVARLVDSLDELRVMERTLAPCDQPPETAPLHNLDATLRNTAKHVFLGAGDRRNLEVMVEMGAAAVGGRGRFRERPPFTVNVCPTSPLGLAAQCCEVVIGAAESGVGILALPMSLAGATAPVTLAGTVVQHDAEVLSALALAQTTRPGTPVIYGCASTIMDLRHVTSATGAPEQTLIGAAAAALARHRGLPSWIGGGISDAVTTDAQAGYEFALNAVLPALSGATIVFGAGALEGGMTCDYAKLLLDCDAIAGISRIVRGLDVSNDALALDAIVETGPYGSYLTHRRTVRNMRGQSAPRWFDRRHGGPGHEEDGDAVDVRARRAAATIIASHEPAPLTPGAEAEMTGLLRDYEAWLGLRPARS